MTLPKINKKIKKKENKKTTKNNNNNPVSIPSSTPGINIKPKKRQKGDRNMKLPNKKSRKIPEKNHNKINQQQQIETDAR